MPYSSKNNKRKTIYDQNHPVNKDKKMYDQEINTYSKVKKEYSYDNDELVFVSKNKEKKSSNNLNKSVENKKIYNNSVGSSKTINHKFIDSPISNDSKSTFNKYNKNSVARKKVIVKKKLKSKSIIVLVLIVLVFTLIPLYIWAINRNNNSNNNIVNNNNSNVNSSNTNNESNTSNKKDEWDLLAENIDFYKKEYKERYINYKSNNPNLDLETVVVYVNIGLDQEFYTNISDSPRENSNLVLVNKYYSLSESYVPNDLETINSKYSSGVKKLARDARISFENLAKEASLNGYTIKAVSTYRSYSYQKQLYSNYVNNDGVVNADTYSARAGHSEHQTGLAVDVSNGKVSYTSFGQTKEFEWMKENAHKYGFILRYTEDFEFITGYKDEPWHYRYVGVDVATYIYENPMTYEEYYVRFLQK